MPEMKPPRIGDQNPHPPLSSDDHLVDIEIKQREPLNYKDIVKNLESFDTEGWDEYPTEKFKKYINENSINVGGSLDAYLAEISKISDNFSVEELSYISAFRAWLQCDHGDAIKYAQEKFDFDCKNNEDFIKKYKFFNVVAFLISENRNNAGESAEIENEMDVFRKLKDSINKNEGSFLLNYLAKDYERVIDGEKHSVHDEQDLDYSPFKLAPDMYGFDERNFFAMVNKHDLPRETFFISEPKDKFEIESIISNPDQYKKTLLKQEAFTKLLNYFKPLAVEDISVRNMSKNESSMDLILFRKLHEKYHRQNIYQITGVNLAEMPLKEQNSFVNYLKFANNIKVERIKLFAKRFDIKGLRTFLSLEHGGKEMGDKILTLGEKLPEEVAEELFKKYSTFVDQANSLESFIKDNFAKDFTKDSELLNKIREYIFKKGEELISSVYSKSNNDDFNADQVLKDLDNIHVEKGLLLSIIKLLKSESNEFNIEDVLALELQTLRPGDFVMAEHLLSNSKLDSKMEKEEKEILDIKKQMEQIYKENYSDMPELQQDLLLDFDNFIKGESKYRYSAGSEINILKYHDKVVSFNRFELVFLNKLNFKSFNVDKSIQGSGIGQLMTKATLDEKAKDNTIIADCLSSKPISSYYIENGFIARKFYSMHGQPCLSIARDDKFIPKEFRTKTLSIDDILAEKNLPNGTIVKRSRTQEECDFSFIVPENYSKVSNPLPNYVAPEKYVLTRYFFDKNSKEWITVFESVEKDLNEYL